MSYRVVRGKRQLASCSLVPQKVKDVLRSHSLQLPTELGEYVIEKNTHSAATLLQLGGS